MEVIADCMVLFDGILSLTSQQFLNRKISFPPQKKQLDFIFTEKYEYYAPVVELS